MNRFSPGIRLELLKIKSTLRCQLLLKISTGEILLTDMRNTGWGVMSSDDRMPFYITMKKEQHC